MTKATEDLVLDALKNIYDDKDSVKTINLHKALKESIEKNIQDNAEAYVKEALEKKGINQEVFGLSDAERAYLGIQKRVQKVRRVFDSNGFVPGVQGRITFSDLQNQDRELHEKWLKNGKMVDSVFPTDQPMIIPRVINEMVRDSVEPIIALTPLMQVINVAGTMGTEITYPAIGDAMQAADVGPNGEYPENSLEFGGQVTAKIGKSGIAVKISDDTIRYNMFDILAMHVRAAGKAMIRHKERKVAKLIFENGVTIFDNTVSGYDTSGRAADGTQNDTMTLDDFLILYADMANEGFMADTVIMHPFNWFAWAREPVMRSLFMQGHNAGMYYQTYQGNVGSASAWKASTLNNNTFFGLNGSTPSSDGVAQNSQTYTLPGILPVPLKVIVTPFQEVSFSSKTSTITIADSARLGMILQETPIETEEFKDPMHDLRKIIFRERYGLALHDNGRAIRHAKNVNWWNRSYNFDDVLSWTAGTGTLPTINNSSVSLTD